MNLGFLGNFSTFYKISLVRLCRHFLASAFYHFDKIWQLLFGIEEMLRDIIADGEISAPTAPHFLIYKTK